MKNSTKESYHQRIKRVVDYMHNHLDSSLSSEKLAEIACLSPFHWHRIYQSITHETPAATLRRLRLSRAAHELINTNTTIDRIAKKAGYSNVDSFTRRFGSDFDLSPLAYRTRGKLVEQLNQQPTKEHLTMYDVDISQQAAFNLATIDHKGDYMEIGAVFEKLIIIGLQHQLLTTDTKMMGIYYDNPDEVPTTQLRSKAGFSIPSPQLAPEGTHITPINGGKYATIIHKGAYADLKNAYDWLFGVWLINSEETPADRPVMEEYLNNPRDTAPADLLTKIYLPLLD